MRAMPEDHVRRVDMTRSFCYLKRRNLFASQTAQNKKVKSGRISCTIIFPPLGAPKSVLCRPAYGPFGASLFAGTPIMTPPLKQQEGSVLCVAKAWSRLPPPASCRAPLGTLPSQEPRFTPLYGIAAHWVTGSRHQVSRSMSHSLSGCRCVSAPSRGSRLGALTSVG